MKKRKIHFLHVLTASLICTVAAFFLAIPIGILVMIAAVPVVYLAYKPLIPTPAPLLYIYNNHLKRYLCKKKAPSPKVSLGGYRKPEYTEFEADFYISPTGSDDGDGSLQAPFLTFERAKTAVRHLDKSGKSSVTVAVCAGKYPVQQVVFEAEDGGTESCPVVYKAHGGEAIIDGGFSIPAAAFHKVTDESIRNRLTPAARDQVLEVDLSALGLTKEQIGVIHVFGAFHTAEQYDGDWIGALHCELFVDDKRQTLARYPNGEQYLGCGKVLYSQGGTAADHNGSFDAAWRKKSNPKSDIYQIGHKLAKRIASWETLEDVWMFGYWMYDWADASTPIGAFDAQKRTLSPKFLSQWGARKNAPYYFFNVLEELDAPGEWYLDRKSLKLYLYPQQDITDAQIMLSVTTQNVLQVNNAKHLTLDGFVIQGTRGDAVHITGDYITVKNCTIRNSAGDALILKGNHNLVANNYITAVGKGGINLDGGDRETLTPGESIVENNLIHSWSQVYKTYCPAVLMNGVGNICRHNEMYDSPHEVIWYHGNDHIIEYNHIHHACLLTKDGGAIYAGKNWSYYGSVVRGNVIHDLGTPYYTACAIYMDDGMSGQTICDNLLVNIPGIAIQLGGGRDYTVTGNTIVGCSNTPIYYDNRAREGAFYGTWFHYCSEPDGYMWNLLRDTAYKSDIWQKHYPQIAAFYESFDQPDNPYFIPNPGCSTVEDNTTFDAAPLRLNIICKEAKKFGHIGKNPIYPMNDAGEYFTSFEIGDYSLKN